MSRTRSMRARSLMALVAIVASAAASCSDGVVEATTTTVLRTTTTTTDASGVFGSVADFLNSVAPTLNIPPGFSGDRNRVTPEFERQFVEAFRSAPELEGLGDEMASLTDDQLLYLGYLYCVGIDSSGDALTSLGVAAGTVAVAGGRQVSEATNADKAIALAGAKYAGGSICGQYQPETEALLQLLGAG